MADYKGFLRFSDEAVAAVNWNDQQHAGEAGVTDETTGTVYPFGGGGDDDFEVVELSFSLASGIDGAVIYGQFIFDYGLETEHIESYFTIESGTVTTHAMLYKGSGSINGRDYDGNHCRFDGDNITEGGTYSAGGSVVINVVSD